MRPVFQRETYEQIIDEIIPLLIRNQQEIDGTHEAYAGLEFEPNFQNYIDLEKQGTLRLYTARRDGQLVGYMVLTVSPSIRYKDTLFAYQDIFYIDRKHRGFGASFLAWSEDSLRFEGIAGVYQFTKTREDLDFSPMLERRDYHRTESVWMKRLDR